MGKNDFLADAREHAILWTGREDLSAQGTGVVRLFSEAERNSRANTFFWKCVLGGSLAVIIPPHVLYPIVGLIAGFIGKSAIRKQKYIFLEGRVNCPKCSSEQKIPKSSEQFPFIYFCSSCSSRAEISCADFSEG